MKKLDYISVLLTIQLWIHQITYYSRTFAIKNSIKFIIMEDIFFFEKGNL